MKIQHEQNAEQGSFFVLDEKQQPVAKLTYFFIDDHTINANHTYVSETLRGQGVADKLYQALRLFEKISSNWCLPAVILQKNGNATNGMIEILKLYC